MSKATLANWRVVGKGPAYVKLSPFVHYQQREVEHWLSTHERRDTPALEPVRDPIRPPFTVGKLLHTLTAIQQRYPDMGDMPCQITFLEAHREAPSQGTLPLRGLVLHEGPDRQRMVTFYVESPDAAEPPVAPGSRPLRPWERSRLLEILNTPSEREYPLARELVAAFLEHGQTPHCVELFNAGFRVANLPIRSVYEEPITVGTRLDLQDLPVFTATGEAIHAWMNSKDPWRLKRCVECAHYFVDVTKNGRKLHCTGRCTMRHGTRRYRHRLAG